MPDEKEKSVTELLDNVEKQGKEDEEEEIEDKDKDKDKKKEKEENLEDDEETNQALETYRLLNDPEKGPRFIAQLAKEYGLELNEKTVTKQKTQIKNILKEKLGDKYDDSHEVISEILESLVDSLRGEIGRELQIERVNRDKRELQREFDSFVIQYKITDKEAAKLDVLMKDMPPNPNRPVSLSNYLSNLLKIVRLHSTNRVTNARERIENNSRRRVENLSTDVSESRLKIGPKRPTIKEAVRAAAMNIKFDSSDED